MATVSSVLGPIDTAEMGFTLSHEHVLVGSAGIQYVYPEFMPRDTIIERGIRDLKEAYDEGVRTIIDVTTIDLGRDIRLLEEVSQGSGVQIICATGTWRDIPRVFWSADPDDITPLYIREDRGGDRRHGNQSRCYQGRQRRGRRHPRRRDNPTGCGQGPQGHRRAHIDPHLGA